LKGQPSAQLIQDDELNRIVRELLHTVPANELAEERGTRRNLPSRHHARHDSVASYDDYVAMPQIELDPALGVITERAQVLTGATGAAIALRKGDEVICRARAGRTAPDLGVRLQTGSGVSAECLRSGEVVLCNNAEDDPHADRLSCQRLGVRSILAAPLREYQKTMGIFEVLSAAPNAFNAQDVATMQLLSSMMVTAIARVSRIGSAAVRHPML